MRARRFLRARIRCGALALILVANAAIADPVQFRAAGVNPPPFQQRLAQQRGAIALPQTGELVGGEMFRPTGNGPFPAILALHGCAGWPKLDFERLRMEQYVRLGYVVLAVDSFTSRGILQACIPGSVHADRVGDAFGALDWLADQPFVEATRVAVLGFSQGGSVALNQ
jgi:dienelactone hydrolase